MALPHQLGEWNHLGLFQTHIWCPLKLNHAPKQLAEIIQDSRVLAVKSSTQNTCKTREGTPLKLREIPVQKQKEPMLFREHVQNIPPSSILFRQSYDKTRLSKNSALC